jgi:hypothetical protein
MLQLILVVLAIMLTSMYLLVIVNYVNPSNLGTNSATSYGNMTVAGFEALQEAYKKATSPAASAFGVLPTTTLVDQPAPAVLGSTYVDGGLAAGFIPSGYLRALPAAPAGYIWSYGGNNVTGVHWFCLSPAPGAGNITTEAVYLGLLKAQSRFNGHFSVTAGGQSTCGDTSSSPPPAGYPADYVATLYPQAW